MKTYITWITWIVVVCGCSLPVYGADSMHEDADSAAIVFAITNVKQTTKKASTQRSYVVENKYKELSEYLRKLGFVVFTEQDWGGRHNLTEQMERINYMVGISGRELGDHTVKISVRFFRASHSAEYWFVEMTRAGRKWSLDRIYLGARA